MKFRVVPAFFLAVMLISFVGCAKKVDPERSIEKIRKEVVSMPLAELEDHASAYVVAIRAQKAEIDKAKLQIQKMPMEKVFSDKSLTRRIAEIGRTAEALFDRYRIYAQAFQEKGGDITKIKLEQVQA